jgi:hypothetical protein
MMPPLPLPPRRPEPAETPEELFGRLQVSDPGLANLWSQQADVLRTYASHHGVTPDVALELPTGSGKTLVGLLIAEWRRLRLEHPSAYVCPTNLARQVHTKATGYGISTVLLIGPRDRWEASETSRFLQGHAVAVTNYHHIFNRTPRIVAPTLVLDDAHTAEGPVADRWSLRLDRQRQREGYFAVLAAIGEELPEHHRRALLSDELDPVQRSRVEVLLPDATARVSPALTDVLSHHVDGTDAWYAWDAIDANLATCIVYTSWFEVLIRPFIAPTFAQEDFSSAAQRVYLSATLGAGGELERSFGRGPIARVSQPADWDREGSGRRYMLAPSAGRDGAEANGLIREVVDRVGRVLLLAPGEWRLGRAAGVVLPDVPRLGVADVENDLTAFTSRPRAALMLANRYDGIDLPGEACQLIILSGLPSGTHQQESFSLMCSAPNTLLPSGYARASPRARVVPHAGGGTSPS